MRFMSMTREAGPSVIQVRTQDVTPEAIGSLVLAAAREHEAALNQGAIVTIQRQRFFAKVRLLATFYFCPTQGKYLWDSKIWPPRFI